MCGLVLTRDLEALYSGLARLRHRGPDGTRVAAWGGFYMGHNRLAIVDRNDGGAVQPFESSASLTCFNGEIFNYLELMQAMNGDDDRIFSPVHSEIGVIDALMRRNPKNFHRYLNGYYAIIRIDKGRRRIILARDFPGVVPLYYSHGSSFKLAVSSDKELPGRVREVMPGETITFDEHGNIKDRQQYDPISLHMDPIDYDHLMVLLTRAVERCLRHSERKVCIALSGGLDSAIVAGLVAKFRSDVEAITVVFAEGGLEAELAALTAKAFGIKHQLVRIKPGDIIKHRERMGAMLEDKQFNPIKRTGMLRNYFTAMHTDATVILCGEGADELACGYPSHARTAGLWREWKAFSTLRSMRAINLDRVNKGGMAFSKEFRVPFLDRSVMMYLMGCKKQINKAPLRTIAHSLGVPKAVINRKAKRSEEDTISEQIISDLWK